MIHIRFTPRSNRLVFAADYRLCLLVEFRPEFSVRGLTTKFFLVAIPFAFMWPRQQLNVEPH